ncbi:MAG: VCBS repeat-containing protein [Gemmataceae bacterium]|nr:VCBS repeat-containing protein [Gemmataceae bacterium]
MKRWIRKLFPAGHRPISRQERFNLLALEDRTNPVVTTSFVGGTLTINLSGSADFALIEANSNEGDAQTSIRVSDKNPPTTGNLQTFNGVNSISVNNTSGNLFNNTQVLLLSFSVFTAPRINLSGSFSVNNFVSQVITSQLNPLTASDISIETMKLSDNRSTPNAPRPQFSAPSIRITATGSGDAIGSAQSPLGLDGGSGLLIANTTQNNGNQYFALKSGQIRNVNGQIDQINAGTGTVNLFGGQLFGLGNNDFGDQTIFNLDPNAVMTVFNSETIGGLNGTGNVGVSAGGVKTLVVGGGNTSSQFDGTLKDVAGTPAGPGGVLALATTGTGTFKLTEATSNYTGDVTINSGSTLVVQTADLNNDNPTSSALGNPSKSRNINVVGTLNIASGSLFGSASATPSVILNVNGGTVTNSNNAATTFGPIVLNGGTMAATGGFNQDYQAFILSGSLTVGGNAPSKITGTGANAGINLGANTQITVADATGNGNADLVISARIFNQNGNKSSAPGGFTLNGPGKLELNAVNAYTGQTTVASGILGGTGTIVGPVLVQSGGTIQPGSTTAGTLSTGMVTFQSGGTFGVKINGSTAGQFDVLKVAGTVNLGNAKLVLADSVFATGPITIINNDGTDPITGMFAQGNVVTGTTGNYAINYQGGDGNDVVLTPLLPAGPLLVDNAGDADDGNYAVGQLTLREAINLSNQNPGADTITFSAKLGDIVLSSAELAITDKTGTTTITGPTTGTQVVRRDTSDTFRIFNINAGASASISNLTIRDGFALANGGGILNFGTLSVTNSTIADNATQFDGGGIWNNGVLTVTTSTISGNNAQAGDFSPGTSGGGGIFNVGTLTLTNSTISGNVAFDGSKKTNGAVGGGINNFGTLTITNATITNNRAEASGGGGGILNNNSGTLLVNTIIAGNFGGSAPGQMGSANDVSGQGVNTSSSNNVIGDAASAGGLTNNFNFSTNTGNFVGVADVLNPTLANNGGPTRTHAINPNGPAIGTGSKSAAPAADQRGFMRPADPTFFPDIGAVEPQLLSLAPPNLINGSLNTPYNQTLTASLPGLPAGTTFTFALDSGNLPAGLTLSSAGVISGTPTSTGTANFSITATASTGDLALPSARSITITATKSPPTISNIVNQAGQPSAVIGPIGFTVGDAETAAGALSVTAKSSNTVLVPVNNVTFGGSGGNRTVSVTPVAGQTGTTTITVTVTDGNGATANDTFLVTISTTPTGPNRLLVGFQQFAAGADAGGSAVTLFNPDGSPRFSVTPFPGFTGGVRTAAADFNSDGVADIIAGTGPGRATRVVVLDGITQKQLFTVDPFEASFTGGVYVAAGDVNGDGVQDLAITPDEGGGPRVDMYSGNGFAKIVSFFGIDDVNFRGGARATIADMTRDSVGDLIVVAGFGGGPRVAAFDGTTLSKTPEKIFGDFFAFEQTLRNGIFVTAGDLNGDGFADLIAGGGPGGGPRVLVFDGQSLLSNQYEHLANFFGGDPDSRGGIRLAVKDLDGDNRADLVVGSGSRAGSRVTAYLGKNIAPAGTPSNALNFDSFAGFTGGVFVG